MRRAVWACISLIVFLVGLGSSGWAVERELVGVRLGESAMGLLDKPGYGQPAYIGPLGTLSVAAVEAQRAGVAVGGVQTRAGAAAGTARSGPAGPAARAGGMRGAGGRGGMGGRGARGGRTGASLPFGLGTTTDVGAPGSQVVLTGAPGGRGGMGGRGMRGGMAAGGARGGAGAVGRAGGQAAPRPTVAAGTSRADAPGMYWYYRRPAGAVVVFRLSIDGLITGITLSGIAPTPGGRTTKGIGLGSHYMDIIASYGYPDQMVSAGTAIEMTYVDHGVRFSLDTMRVREIAIGAHVAAEASLAPAAVETAPPPPAGLSIEELRGYL